MDKIEALKVLNPDATKLQLRKALQALHSMSDQNLGDILGKSRQNMCFVMNGRNTSRLMQDEVAEIFGVPRKAIFD